MTSPTFPLPFDVPYVVRALDGDHEVDVVPIDRLDPLGAESFVAAGRGRYFAAEARWRRRDGPLERWDVAVEVTMTRDAPVDAGLVVSAHLPVIGEPHWLIPGLFYGDNRPSGSTARYPRFAGAAADDPWAAPAWGFRADRAATPVVFARGADGGVALATTETGPLGLNGLGFGMVATDGRGRVARSAERSPAQTAAVAELHLAFPYREEPVVYDGAAEPRPPDRPGHRWEPGQTVWLSFTAFATPPQPYAWAPVLRDLHEELAATSALNPWLEPARAAALAAEGLLRWHVRPEPPVILETIAFNRPADGTVAQPGDREAMHVAWLSGAPPAAALLVHGRRVDDPEAIGAATAVLDHIAGNLAPCGTFWGQWTRDRGWTKGWTPGEDRLHARTLAEAALFMIRASAFANTPAPIRWRDAVISNLEFVVARQRADGAIPAAWHARTGEPAAWDGCAGLAWVPCMIEGARLLDRPDLLEPARRAGAYYARFVEAELLFGAPEDVDLGPTSEDGYVAVMAYVALAEAAPAGPDRDPWLALATRAAEWMLTFRYAWNVAFDAATELGRLDYRTRGMDQASPANQHLHVYGLVALAETVRLARATGDARLIERAREHFAAARQVIARFDGDFGARRGMAPERFYQTACFGPKGELGRLSHAWCLGLLLWACEMALDVPELLEPEA